MNTPSVTPAARRWATIVSEFEHSGLTLRAFAARHQINASTLAWWRSRLRSDSQLAPRFRAVEVRVEEVAPPPPALRVELAGGAVVVVVPVGVDLEQLRSVVAVLA